jgi:peptidoglycan/xylan/chitin deacetylase (PgdA/CDA1 family)
MVILMYHGVERRAGPLFVAPGLFEEQVDAIVDSGLPVLTIGEIGRRLREGTLPTEAVALTFDDAFASVAEHAAPRLAERGLRATIFCVAAHLGGTNQWPSARDGAPRVSLADPTDLAQLAHTGFEIGAHGMVHAPLVTGDPQTIREEIVEARALLEDRIGVEVSSFAYPYGAPPSAAAREAVASTYSAVCTTRIGRVGPETSTLELPRIDVHYLRSRTAFAAVLAGRGSGYLMLRRLTAHARRRLVADYVAPSSTGCGA